MQRTSPKIISLHAVGDLTRRQRGDEYIAQPTNQLEFNGRAASIPGGTGDMEQQFYRLLSGLSGC